MQTTGQNTPRRRVLLVGARDSAQPAVRQALAGSGWDLRIAAFAPGDDLLPWFQERPDVVVVDGIGAGSGVLTMLGKLREFDANRDIPFVALVDGEAPDLVSGAYESGAADVMTEPLEPARIADRVQFQARSARVVGSVHSQLEELLHAQRLGGTGSWTLGILSGLIRWSAEAERLLGVGVGQGPRDVEALLDILPEEDRELLQHAFEECAEQGQPIAAQHRVLLASGEMRWLEQAIEPVRMDAKTVGLRGTVRDITAVHQAEQDLRVRESNDGLTGLATRGTFRDAVDEAIARTSDGAPTVAVLAVDLDDFRRVNHVTGERGGDTLLQYVAEVLKSVVTAGAEDSELAPQVARLSGDTFAVLLPELPSTDAVADFADRILEGISVPVPIGGQEVSVSASVGSAVHPTDGTNAERLLQHAELALSHAKGPCGRRESFRRSMGVNALRRFTLASDLRMAVERGELRVVYQPRVRASDGRTLGAEALVRWDHPTLGSVSPGEFIPIAEQAGLIGRIGNFVLRTACREFRALRYVAPEARVSVNVSSWQLAQTDIWETVTAALRETELPPAALELEITESLMIDDGNDPDAALRDLKGIGIEIALDDFGTGYTSLSYVSRFPVDVIKLDRTLTREAGEDPKADRVAQAIVHLAHELDMRVVGEGVDSEAQAAAVRAFGVDEIQGFLIAGALEMSELRERLRAESEETVAPDWDPAPDPAPRR